MVQVSEGEEADVGDKAHPVGIPGRTAAAWQSSLDCPSWNLHPGFPSVFEEEAQTKKLVAAAVFADQGLFLVVANTLRVEVHEVENWAVQSIDQVAKMA